MSVHIYRWADGEKHREQIIGAVRAARSNHPTSGLDVATGWSGPKNLFESRNSGIVALHNFIQATLPARSTGWELAGWGNVMVSGDHVKPHDHVKVGDDGRANVWAGVYYVQVPRRSPPLAMQLFSRASLAEVSRETMLIVFPADLVHSVPAAIFDGERVSIAFNAKPAAL